MDHPVINLTAGSKVKSPFIVASKVSSGGASAIIPLQGLRRVPDMKARLGLCVAYSY